jgi:thiamine transport system substrate-binding protein
MKHRSVPTIVASVAIAVVLATVAAACGSDSTASATTSSRSKDKGAVQLLTYDGYALPDPAAKDFEKQQDLTLKMTTADDAGAALSQVLLTAGHPSADVFFGVDNTFLTKALASDAFVKYEPKALAEIPADFKMDPSGRFTPVDAATVCVDYDKGWFSSHHLAPPTDLATLGEKQYQNLLVVEDPALSSPGLAFLAATHATFGAATDDYWRKLKANGVLVASSWDDAWNSRYSGTAGDRPLVVSYASSPPAEVVDGNGKVKEPKTGVIESTCFNQVEFAAILKGAPHMAAAKKLVDEMVSKSWQEGLPLSNYVYPVLPGASMPPVFQQWAVVPSHPISISAQEIGAHRDEWIDSWRSIMQ